MAKTFVIVSQRLFLNKTIWEPTPQFLQLCWYLFRLHGFRTGCKLFIWCQLRKLRVISVPSLGCVPEEQQTGQSAGCWGAPGPTWKPLTGLGEWVDVTGRVGWRNISKVNELGVFRWDIKRGKGALGEKLLLKRLNMLVSEMGSEPGGRNCGFGLGRLEHVQNKQTKWNGMLSLWQKAQVPAGKPAVVVSSRFGEPGHPEHLQSRAEELLRVPLSRILPQHCLHWRRERRTWRIQFQA